MTITLAAGSGDVNYLSTQTTPTHDAPGLGLYFPEANGGANLTGLQAAHDAAATAGGGTVVLQAGVSYTYPAGSTGLTVDPTKVRFVGAGAILDATAMTSGVALTFSATSSDYAQAPTGGFEGVDISGPGKASTVKGVRVTGTSSYGTLDISMRGSAVHDFAVGVDEGDYAWAYNWFGCSIYNCAKAVDNSTIASNGGERLTYIGTNIHDNDLAISAPSVNGDHYFIGCSFDFNGQLAQVTGQHSVFITNSHVEYRATTTAPVALSGTNPVFVIRDSLWAVHSPTYLTAPLTSGVAVTTLSVNDVPTAITSGDTITITDAGGHTDTFTASSNVSVGATSIPVTSHAPSRSWTGDGYSIVLDSTALPTYVVDSSSWSAPDGKHGAWFTNVLMTGVCTTSGAFMAGGVNSSVGRVYPLMIDSHCLNPTTGNLLTFPSALRIDGTLYQAGSRAVYNADALGLFPGTFFAGDGGGSLTHSSGSEGYYNTGVGAGALTAITSGNSDTAVGHSALHAVTTGTSNTAVGESAAAAVTTGASNTGVGRAALGAVTTGGQNSGVGQNALAGVTTSNQNTASGYEAGHYLSDGTTANATPTQGLYLGWATKASAAGLTNETVIGAGAIGSGSNTTTIGNTNVTLTQLRGIVLFGKSSTGSRPSASSMNGGMYYDTTLNKPIWSDGTNWRDAAGTIV